MSCTCHPAPLTFGRRVRICTRVRRAATANDWLREVTDVETTMTWTTYVFEPRAVTLPTVGSGTVVGAGPARRRVAAPLGCTVSGTRMSSFGASDAGFEASMNKSIAQFPTDVVVGVSGIRSWSPPV